MRTVVEEGLGAEVQVSVERAEVGLLETPRAP
jgi:hypothetical protein